MRKRVQPRNRILENGTYGTVRGLLSNRHSCHNALGIILNMTDIVIIKGNPLAEFVSKAVELEAREIEVEYKDGYEEITVLKGQMGFGIARLESSGKEATNLRKTALRDN